MVITPFNFCKTYKNYGGVVKLGAFFRAFYKRGFTPKKINPIGGGRVAGALIGHQAKRILYFKVWMKTCFKTGGRHYNGFKPGAQVFKQPVNRLAFYRHIYPD